MSIKEALSLPIKSADDQILRSVEVQASLNPNRDLFPSAQAPWWLKREWLRKEHGVYEEDTEVLRQLNASMPHHAFHVALKDRNLVAYTPDAHSGEQDRQVSLSINRLLARLYPSVASNVIADVAASHTSELDYTVELLAGEAINDVYASGAAGACMSKADANVYSCGGHRPTEVYDAPGIFMAVDRDLSGTIIGRAMVFHASETDKRIIRVYNSKALTRKLHRQGYVEGCWHGAKFKLVDLGDASNSGYENARRIMVPYLDGNGGPASGSHTSAVALIDGELVSITSHAYDMLRRKYGSVAAGQATSTSGYLTLVPVVSENLTETCFLSGVVLSDMYMSRPKSKYYDAATDTVYNVSQDLMESYGEDNLPLYKVVTILTTGISTRVYVPQSAATFTQSYTVYLDTPEARRSCGFYELDPIFYPRAEGEPRTFIGRYDYKKVYGFTEEGLSDGNERIVKPDDAVEVIYTHGSMHIHKSGLTKAFVKVHSTRKGKPLYAHPTVDVVKTNTGRKVVTTYHSVCQLLDGTWCFSRSTSDFYLAGQTFFVASAAELRALPTNRMEIPAVRAYIKGRLDEVMPEAVVRPQAQGMCSLLDNIGSFFVPSTGRTISYYRPVPLAQVKEALVHGATSGVMYANDLHAMIAEWEAEHPPLVEALPAVQTPVEADLSAIELRIASMPDAELQRRLEEARQNDIASGLNTPPLAEASGTTTGRYYVPDPTTMSASTVGWVAESTIYTAGTHYVTSPVEVN